MDASEFVLFSLPVIGEVTLYPYEGLFTSIVQRVLVLVDEVTPDLILCFLKKTAGSPGAGTGYSPKYFSF